MASLFGVAVNGDLKAYAKDHEQAMARALTQSVRGAAGYFQKNLQKQIRANFKDASRFAQSLAKKNTPSSGYSLTPLSVVDPKAVYAAGTSGRTQDVDLVDLFNTAGTVTAHGHDWIAIPGPYAPWKSGRGANRRASPAESGILKFIFLLGKTPNEAHLFIRQGRSKELLLAYTLEKASSRSKKLDVDGPLATAGTMISANFEANWAAESAALDAAYGIR